MNFDELLAKVRAAHPDSRPAAIIVKSDPAASVAVNLGRENTIFVNPYSGEILGGQSATHNFLRDVVDWHRWLGTEGEGRATAAHDHRRMQSRLLLACDHRRLSLVAAELAMARTET